MTYLSLTLCDTLKLFNYFVSGSDMSAAQQALAQALIEKVPRNPNICGSVQAPPINKILSCIFDQLVLSFLISCKIALECLARICL
jgi:hypothetical protein